MNAALNLAIDKLDRLSRRFPCGFPSGYGDANVYQPAGNIEWTAGFWTGLLWLAYQRTGLSLWRERAEALLPSFVHRLEARGAGVETHDLGFLYTLSAVAAWRTTGDATARSGALRAADLLAARYLPRGHIIQAWGRLDDPQERGRIIVDSAMNMPLLFWAASESGVASLRDIATRHLDQCIRLLVRPDGSTFHTFFVDAETGEGRYGRTHQGFSDFSCWSRGQAWAIYGFSLAYRYTREARYLDVARRLARYFLDHVPPDGICRWDLTFGSTEKQEPDTSAAAIAVSGLQELAALLGPDDPDRPRVAAEARRVLEILVSAHASTDPAEDGILLHGVCHRPLGLGVNECCLWGDYFYVEALARLEPAWSSFW
jgi:unsaturated chondroitin disaccharide hydrolase